MVGKRVAYFVSQMAVVKGLCFQNTGKTNLEKWVAFVVLLEFLHTLSSSIVIPPTIHLQQLPFLVKLSHTPSLG